MSNQQKITQTLDIVKRPFNGGKPGLSVFREFEASNGDKVTIDLNEIAIWEEYSGGTSIVLRNNQFAWTINMQYSKFNEIMKTVFTIKE
jgi:hypothetical protein